jgi:thiamine biosynthesis protein ThiS
MITLDGKQVPWHPGMDVEQLLAFVEKPEQYAVVRLNGKPVSRPNFRKTPVPDNAEVILVPMIAGG